ncbi:MAG: hypothetical protein Q9163_004200 [Psora crenata]
MPRVTNPPRAKQISTTTPLKGSYQSPLKIPLNDDRQEKAVRLQSRQALHELQMNTLKAAVSPMRKLNNYNRAASESPKTPRSHPARGKENLEGCGLSVVAPAAMTPMKRVPILANFEEWMKMATDNKINATNSWNFALIDYFHDMSLLKEGDGVNFQKASCTLDGCVKIYTNRVDSVATETGKLLSGLADSGSRKSKRDGEGEEEGEDAEDEEGQEGVKNKTKKRAQRSSEATLAPSFASLHFKKMELEFSVDPLFKKASADFDEGGAKGLLLNHLSIDSNGRIVFDSSDDIEDASAEGDGTIRKGDTVAADETGTELADAIAKSRPKGVGIDIGALAAKFFPDLARLDEQDICPSLKNFDLGDTSGSADIPFPKAPEDWRQEGKDSQSEGVCDRTGVVIDGDNVAGFDDDDGILDGLGVGTDAGFGEGGEAWANEVALDPQMHVEYAGYDSSGGKGQTEGIGVNHFDPASNQHAPTLHHTKNEGDHQEILSYFDNALQKNWAGPEHWRIKRIRDVNKPAAPARSKRKEKQPFVIDFNAPLEASLAEILYTPASSNAAISLPKAQWKSKTRNLLPDDKHFNSRQLLRLFLKPKARMGSRRPGMGNLRQLPTDGISGDEMDEAFWARKKNATDQTPAEEGAPQGNYDANFFQDDGIGFPDGPLEDGEDFADAREAFSPGATTGTGHPVDGNLEPAQGSQEGAFGTQLVTQSRRLRPEYVQYARVAKKVDVRKLKEEMWRGIGFDDCSPMQAAQHPPPKTDDTPLRFTSVINNLQRVYPKEAMNDISTSYCFICLLHLANEKGLRIDNEPGLEELSIRRDSAAEIAEVYYYPLINFRAAISATSAKAPAMASRGIGHANPHEEMFLEQPPRTSSPTVEPLRIYKRDSRSPDSGIRNGAFPLPPGASSSPSPLPYPDDRHQSQAGRSSGRTLADGQVRASPMLASSPPRGGTFDPSRAGIPEYPPSLRPQNGRDMGLRLAERRGNAPKPLPDSPGPEAPDKEGLFQKPPQRPGAPSTQDARRPTQAESNPYPEYYQQYWPPPGSSEAGPSQQQNSLSIPKPAGVNRLSSTASTSTTKAQRGSPPPPETPILPPEELPGGGIEARYAAAGIAGTSTLTSLQAQNAAAAQRASHYTQPGASQQRSEPIQRRWTPTEQPGTQPHGPPTVYQGPGHASGSPPIQAPTPQAPTPQASTPQAPTPQVPIGSPHSSRGNQPRPAPLALEQDMQRMHMSASPPPAYSPSGSTATNAHVYPNEKQGHQPTPAAASVTAASVSPQSSNLGHPAFANDLRPESSASQRPEQTKAHQIAPQIMNSLASPGLAGPGPASPPPLPEGWIAHLDPNSGQYYYIHLPTQSTQWEFPKGPTPLNLNEPLSPTGSVKFVNPLSSPSIIAFNGKAMASPGFQPATPGFPDSVMSLGSATPTVAGFSGPPPTAGVDMYKIAPTNGVYFGPYLRYTNMDLENGVWLGSILLVTDAPQPPTIHIHQSVDLSPNPRQLKASSISVHQRWTFYRYDIDLQMEEEGSAKWTYAITSHLGCTRYEFLVAGKHETNWRLIATSGNDFSLSVNANERARVGGIGFMWKDIMQKHVECGGFHIQLGLGDQIFADRVWKEIPLLKQWLAMSGKENRKNVPWTAKHEEDVSHAYFHYYTSHFDQPYLREAFAQIPHVLQVDDHDIFDGFGSYPEYMQFSNMFKNIGRVGIDMYLLFQHHTTLEILRNVSTDTDIFTITGTGWHFVKFLGPAVAVVGPDCRSERNPHQVMAGPTYQGLFPKVAMLPQTVQHCIWMIAVPIIYPRLEAAEQLAHTVATGKKAVTGTYNLLGKVTSSVAGVVGAKGVVGSGFDSVKKAVGKSGLMGGILSPFGDIDMLDELRDQWTHESKDLERTYLIRTLQSISHQKSLRMTFLSGSVSVCGAGLVHDPSKPSDHKTMYQIISSSVVNTPPPSYVLKLLHSSQKPLYVPQNGHRSTNAPSDTKEDMMEIFTQEPDGRPREARKLMGRRNWVAMVAYDPEVVQGTYAQTSGSGKGGGRLSLAVDFMVQSDGPAGAVVATGPVSSAGTSKYGPVIVPSLEYGR